MHVALLAGDVQVAAQDHPLGRPALLARPLRQRLEEADLRRVVLVAVRHVDGGDERVARSRRDDAVLVIELRMLEARLAREGRLAQMKRNPGVALVAVPVAPVSLERGKLGRNVLRRSLDLLHAEDIRRLARDPFPDLRHPRPDPVDVPGGDLHRGALVSPRAGRSQRVRDHLQNSRKRRSSSAWAAAESPSPFSAELASMVLRICRT